MVFKYIDVRIYRLVKVDKSENGRVVQLVERWSPKPKVASSILASLAKYLLIITL